MKDYRITRASNNDMIIEFNVKCTDTYSARKSAKTRFMYGMSRKYKGMYSGLSVGSSLNDVDGWKVVGRIRFKADSIPDKYRQMEVRQNG